MLLSELFEQEGKHITFCFGRMNPPTIGHEQVFNTMAKVGGEYFIFLSQTQDKKENPLSYEDKIKFIEEMFPQHASHIVKNKELNTIVKVASYLYEQGYRHATFVAGSDRIDSFKKLLRQYNGEEGKAHGYYKFEVLDFISSGERDPDSGDISGVSASKARAAAAENNFEEFKKATGAGEVAKEMFVAVRNGLGIKESIRENKMRAKNFIPPSKPRNPVVRQQQTSGAGVHKDKKKAQKQGDVKHKGKVFAEEGNAVDIAELQKQLQELEQRKEILRSAVEQARKITTEIKYDDTVMDIVTRIQALAEKTGISEKEVGWAINEVNEKANELESAVYALDDAFTEAYRDISNRASDLEYEIDDYQNESRRNPE